MRTLVGNIADDIRLAVRALGRRPGLVAAIAIPLALGIGANSAIFGIVDAVLFRPLPVRAPEGLVKVYAIDRNDPSELNVVSYPVFQDYRDGVAGFSGLAAYADPHAVHVTTEGAGAERVACMAVSGNYFEVLGVVAARGRALEPADDAPGAERVAVLADRYWRAQFGADPNVVGTTVRLDGHAFAVVGVAPAGFSGIDLDSIGGVPDLWVTTSNVDVVLSELAELNPLTGRNLGWLYLVGRLGDGVSLHRVQAELDGVAAERAIRQAGEKRQDTFARALPAVDAALDPASGAETTRMAWLLVGIVGCVLLIACVDAAGLLLARGEERRRELAIRQAIGASRRRVVRQLLVESLVVSILAAALGLLVAGWVTDAFVALAPPDFALSPETLSPVGGGRVLAYTCAVAVLVSVLFGTLPALRATKVDLVPALKSEVRYLPAMGRGLSLRSAFLIVQVALSVVLLAGSALLLRSLWNAFHEDPGFDAAMIASATVDLARQGYEEDRGMRVLDEILASVRSLPGVRAASLSRSVPLQRSGMRTSVEFEGVEPDPDAVADLVPVSPGFFTTIGVPVLRGRDFLETDTRERGEVVVVNTAFAERFWPGLDPLGRRIANYGEKGAEVVGVVADFKLHNLREEAPPIVFVSHKQFYLPRISIAVRVASDPATVLGSMRAAVARVDPGLPAFDLRTGEEKLGVTLARERIVAALLATFAALAALLTATGFYGAFAYQTRLRTREFAIRLALGARANGLLRAVVGRGAGLAALGVAVGLAIAYGLSGLLATLVFGVEPADPVSFVVAALVLLALPAAASYGPARRAARVDPATALREE